MTDQPIPSSPEPGNDNSETHATAPADEDPLSFTPVPLKHYRHDGWTPERQREFIAALAVCGSVPDAAHSIGMGFSTAYRLRNKPGAEEFNAAWEQALAKATSRIHDVLVDHAVNGAPEPIMYGGKQVGEFRRFNYRLMMWLLRHHRPDKFTFSPDAINTPAMTKQRLTALKKQWRAEWEAEQVEADEASSEITERLYDRLEDMRRRMIADYVDGDPETETPPQRFDPTKASMAEIMIYDSIAPANRTRAEQGDSKRDDVAAPNQTSD